MFNPTPENVPVKLTPSAEARSRARAYWRRQDALTDLQRIQQALTTRGK